MNNPAFFFDRDDTLLKDANYMHRPEQLCFLPGVFKTLKKLQDAGYLLFIVTNQSGIGRGYFTEKDMHEFHRHMLLGFKEQNIEIKDIAFCPHAPEDKCQCRKPEPKLILDLCQKYHIDPNTSFMVGDKDSDIQAGENAGLTSIKVGAGYKNSIQNLPELLNFTTT